MPRKVTIKWPVKKGTKIKITRRKSPKATPNILERRKKRVKKAKLV